MQGMAFHLNPNAHSCWQTIIVLSCCQSASLQVRRLTLVLRQQVVRGKVTQHVTQRRVHHLAAASSNTQQ
jgi:hypothetical protein